MKTSKILIGLLLLTVSLASDCPPGSVRCSSGSCHYPVYIEGCAKYQSSNACAECQYNYVKQGPFCFYSPKQDQNSCCIEYSKKTGGCVKCANGLYLDEFGICKDIKIVGCIEKSSDGYGCANCAKEFILSNGKCFKRLNHCAQYNSDGSCNKCDKDCEFVDGNCIKTIGGDGECEYPFTRQKDGNCWVDGCKSVYELGCKSCAQGFSLLPDGSCRNGRVTGCSKYNSKGKCVECLKPLYTIAQDGICLPIGCTKANDKGECNECDKGKGYLLAKDGYCRIKNCLISDEKGCQVCQRGFIETANGCERPEPKVVCQICPRGSHLSVGGKCVANIQGCLEYENGRCVKCENDLFLAKTSQCEKKIPGCLYENGVCTKCTTPFRYNHHKQTCFIEGCADYSPKGCRKCQEKYTLTQQYTCNLPHCLAMEDYKCKKCHDGYKVSGEGLCYATDPNCQTYDISNNCIQCLKGYYMNRKGICSKENFGCNYVDGRCVSCRAPFSYNPNTESCEIDGCVNYFLGGCQKCSTGYDLRYNSCKLPHCLVSHKGHCRECDPDYIMKSDGTCVNKDEFCHKYNGDGNCVECAEKYYLSSINGKCKKRDPGCFYNLKDECYKCEKPFYFDGIRCEIHGCLTLGYDGCSSCFYPMQVTKQKLCQVANCDRMEEGRCLICKPGYTLTDKNACKLDDPKCLVVSAKGQGCEKCYKGYKVDRNGKCEYADEHCWQFTKQGHCANCDRLYFLNPLKKCQIRDSNCKAYSNGYCQQCKDYFYTHRGLCFPNSKGCLVQKNIKQCSKCEQGYEMEQGKCTPQITKLSYNSIKMDFDFFDGETDHQKEEAQMIFTIGKDSKKDLEPALAKGGKQFFSKSEHSNAVCQVDSQGNGWRISKSAKGEFAGVRIPGIQTFYAVDVKALHHNSLTKFEIQYSEDGEKWISVGQFRLKSTVQNSVQTIYFTPVYAVAMRIVVLQGHPDIKFDFYFNANRISSAEALSSDSYISKEILKAAEQRMSSQQIKIFEAREECVDKALCWLGLQLCEPKQIFGFGFLPGKDNKGKIEQVTLDYSVDGVKFECYNQCKPIKVHQNVVKLDKKCVGSKFRVHLSKWDGQPKFGIAFDYQHY